MHPNAERIQAELRSLGADGEVVELAASTRTSQEAAEAIGTTVAKDCKDHSRDNLSSLVLAVLYVLARLS